MMLEEPEYETVVVLGMEDVFCLSLLVDGLQTRWGFW